ncbi:PadR family transcriptional regulator [Nitrospirillum viridazoti]|uniref:PadR family transcriptional regulator n=1 Tax=Nitrospirillum amazonense TaxID=28077 RepID=A0A560IT63_9PROT|nr:PadR family transcriptional regulator [Nitrospirillum amazonense]TWB62253.1 PadR family transcriptional regulator [Nitrospirillum amazonense]
MVRDTIGSFEKLVLSAVHRLAGQGYAVSIVDEIEKRTAQAPNPGAVYATLDRLQKKGFISSRLGEPTAERGGRRKRFYAIEAPGIRAMAAAQEIDRKLWDLAEVTI